MNALAAARALGEPTLAPYMWPEDGEHYVGIADWLRHAEQPRLSQRIVTRLDALAHRWESALRTRMARGARGPRAFVVVEQDHLRRAGLDAVAVLRSTATEHHIRLQLTNPARVSVYAVSPADAARRLTTPAADRDCLRFVLDCFLLALLYDMCVANVLLIPISQAGRPDIVHRSGDGEQSLAYTPSHPRGSRSVSYLPDRDRAPRAYHTGESHASPALHDVTWFIRRLLPGWETSGEAREHARVFGVELKPGETFVLPHVRGRGRQYFCLGDRELWSTHAVAEFERTFLN